MKIKVINSTPWDADITVGNVYDVVKWNSGDAIIKDDVGDSNVIFDGDYVMVVEDGTE